MAHVERFLHHLGQSEVTEVAMVTGRLPCAKINGTFKPVDSKTMSTDAILELLLEAGGRRYVHELDQTPTSWTFRVEGVGTVAVAAIQAAGGISARFAVTDRETKAPVGPAPMTPMAPMPPIAPLVSPANASAMLPNDDERTLVSRTGFHVPSAGKAAPNPSLPQAHPATGPNPATTASTATTATTALRGAPSASSPSTARSSTVAQTSHTTATTGAWSPIRPDLKPYFREARERRASDLHFVAERPPLLRLCGELLPSGPTLPASLVQAAAMEMIPARLHTRFEEEGTVDFSLTTEHFGRFRANVTRQRTGLKVCLRLIGETMPTLESLGLPESIRKATHHHQGLIVITGPTGHGKTTTLAALIDHINSTTSHHVITVEDPIEYVHSPKMSMMSQREVGTHTKTFRSALKASLREDPDVIVIGELRDTDTVRIALAASETGHLVLGTMNTPSASKTIDRLIDLFPPSDQQQVRLTLAGGLKLILSQRLVPTTDGTGSLAACEILPGSVPLWNLIRENKTFQIPSLQQRGKALGIVRLEEALADLVRQGKTTLERVRPFGDNVDELLAKPAAAPGAAAALGAPGTPLAGRATTAAPHDQTEETGPKSALLDLAKRKLGLKKDS